MSAPARTQPATLFDPPEAKRGRTRRALERQLTAARKAGELDKRDTLMETARALADSLDLSRARKDPYAVVQVARELRECMAVLIPIEDDGDAFADLLNDLASATGPAEVPTE